MYGYFICILYGPHLHVTPNEARRGHQSLMVLWGVLTHHVGAMNLEESLLEEQSVLVLYSIKSLLKSRNGCVW